MGLVLVFLDFTFLAVMGDSLVGGWVGFVDFLTGCFLEGSSVNSSSEDAEDFL